MWYACATGASDRRRGVARLSPTELMSHLSFQFAFPKLTATIAYFAMRGVPLLDQLKTVKLLYFADKEHLFKYGRPIIGDTYFCMQHGPVASFSKNVIDDTLNGDSAEGDSELLRYVDVVPPGAHRYATFKTKAEPDLSQLSQSEVEVLDDVIQRYGPKSGWALRELTHRDECWKQLYGNRPSGQNRVPLPYEEFFMGADSEAQETLALAQEEQKDRDLAQDFFR